MKVQIIKRNLGLKGEFEREIQAEAVHSCERLAKRFLDRINSVTMRLSDINGPKGGIDKECHVQIHLNNGATITASKRHQHIPGAMHRCINTARSLLARKLGQRKGEKLVTY